MMNFCPEVLSATRNFISICCPWW